MANYYDHIDPSYAQLTSEIIQSYDPVPENEVEAAAAVHNNLYRELEYETRWETPMGRAFRNLPDITRLGGNCEEKGVFLASLLKPYNDIDIHLYELEAPDEDAHLTVGLQFPNRTLNEVGDILSNYYQKCSYTSPRDRFYEIMDHLFADPDIEHIGEAGWMKDEGYFTKVGNDQYKFYKIRDAYPIH
ncbi:hypothetical protein ACM16X_02510 [Haloarcula japonica]|uniref:hypothetical protein n=1 Tax=Haloarcula japonica TaxID=29282 RepID=UPI0039F729FB